MGGCAHAYLLSRVHDLFEGELGRPEASRLSSWSELLGYLHSTALCHVAIPGDAHMVRITAFAS